MVTFVWIVSLFWIDYMGLVSNRIKQMEGVKNWQSGIKLKKCSKGRSKQAPKT